MLNLHPMLADVVWPALYLIGRLLSFRVISAGPVIEFFFVWRLTRMSLKRSPLADVLMNLASALLGLVFIPLAGLLVILPFTSTFGYGAWVATFCAAVLINGAVESLVLRKVFRRQVGRRGSGCWCSPTP